MSEPTQHDLHNILNATDTLTAAVATLLTSLSYESSTKRKAKHRHADSELPPPDLDPQVIIDELNDSTATINDYLEEHPGE